MKSEGKPSFQKIHYLLRPAKNIQRKMFGETLQLLAHMRPIAEFQYIGFGSIYFGDFVLFHRSLGFKRMTSIEMESNWNRAEFNKPYSCVTVLSGRASEKLPEVEWADQPAVVWLDYDCGLNTEILNDVAHVAAHVLPVSFLLVTLDATEEALNAPPDEETTSIDLEAFEEASLVGRLNLKCGSSMAEDTDLTGGNLEAAYRQLVTDSIQGSVNSITDPRTGVPSVSYSQVLNFHYSDGRDMMTVGGVFSPLAANGESRVSEFGFDKLAFYRPGADSFNIEVPKLTFREIRELNEYLPCSDVAAIPVPIDEIDKTLYSLIYRYFPAFAEADVST
jgi:hypothetical protein